MTGATIRHELPGDHRGIHAVNTLAFEQALEADLVDAIRRDGLVTCSLVAQMGTEIVGHILFTTVAIDQDPEIRAVGLGPMAVHPGYQRQGIGTLLVEAGLSVCRQQDREAVVVLGHPEFYPRFGFLPASRFGLRCEFPVPDDVFLAMELVEGALPGRTGLVRYLPHFNGAA
jgi:putative acetyltransferase